MACSLSSRLELAVVLALTPTSSLPIGEWLSRYRPGSRVLVIAMIPEADPHTYVPSRHQGIADYVVLTGKRSGLTNGDGLTVEGGGWRVKGSVLLEYQHKPSPTLSSSQMISRPQ